MRLDLPDLLEFQPGDTQAPRILPHCGKCGRFIKPKTVREIRHWENWLESDSRGDCSVCGPDVAVSWPEV